MRSLALCSILVFGSAGCTLANLTPQMRFSESAYTLNDAARWGQVDKAITYVSPRYQARFAERHREWGEGVNIAEVELVRLQLSEDSESAVSEITLSWYDGGMMVRSSTVTQKWESERGKYKLVDEAVRRGDPAVFAPPVTSGS